MSVPHLDTRMVDGKKSVAERIVYGAFEAIVAKGGGKDPLEVFSAAPYPTWTALGVNWLAGFDFEIKVIARIPKLGVDMTANWNHRYRENMDRLKSGDLDEVSAVIKALMHRDSTRGLSNGERKMLHIAKQILVSEIVLAEDVEYPEAEGRVNAAMLLKESD